MEIAKPAAPITRSPIAETFEIVLNSVMLGFFRSRQTLMYFWECRESFRRNLIAIIIRGVVGF